MISVFFVTIIAMNGIKWVDRVSSFGMDLLILAIGVLFFTSRYTGWTVLYILIVVLCFFLPVRHFLSIRSGAKPATRSDYLIIAFNLLFGIILLVWPNQFMTFIHVFFGWWMLGHGILLLITFYVYLHDQLPGAVPQLFAGVFSVVLAIFMILGRNMTIKTEILSILAGIYFVLYGALNIVFHLIDLRRRIHPGVRSISLSSPVIISAFLPIRFYISIKRLKADMLLRKQRESSPSDVRVYVYIKGKGPEMFGHLDISYKGQIWSYGNHDPASRRLNGTYGDGVLIRADETKFLEESIHTDGKTVIGFSLHLTDQQKKMLEARMDALMSRAVPWKCAARLAHDRGEDMSGCVDYASRVYRETFCEMYKFKSGKFRTYFVSSTNCVMLADELIRNRDLNLIDINGVITPGAYLSFLNTQYLKENTSVVSRIFYEEGVSEPVANAS